MDLARRDARVIYAGKESSKHTMPQGDINQLLVELARRSVGGSPGRVATRSFSAAAAKNSKPWPLPASLRVVPGVTAATGCAAYSGFPLTHRDHAQAVTFVTGHLKDGTVNLDWSALARPCQTVVFYMGIGCR